MTPSRRRLVVVIALLWARLFFWDDLALAQSSDTEDLAIVVHPSTPVNGLTFAELRQVFLGERQYWTRGMPVVLLMRAPVAVERDAVLRVIYEMTEGEFKQYWIAKIFRAQSASPPKIVYSNDTANQLVGSIPGAIAFVVASDVGPGLKALRVDGRLPGEPGYRFHVAPP
jgi:ABC-type phosphate transport system substrate-binding protein